MINGYSPLVPRQYVRRRLRAARGPERRGSRPRRGGGAPPARRLPRRRRPRRLPASGLALPVARSRSSGLRASPAPRAPAVGRSALALPGHRRRARPEPAHVPRGALLRGRAAEPRDGHDGEPSRRPRAVSIVVGRPGVRAGVPHVRALPAASGRRVRRALPGPRRRAPPRCRDRPGAADPRRAGGRSRAGVGRRGVCRSSWSMPGRSSSASLGRTSGRRPSTGCSSSPRIAPTLERAYEVEALPHRLGERADPAASGGWAAYADPVESLRGELLGGPARLFPAGRYRLALRLRAAAAGPGPARAALGHGAGGADPGRARGGRAPRCRPAPTGR